MYGLTIIVHPETPKIHFKLPVTHSIVLFVCYLEYRLLSSFLSSRKGPNNKMSSISENVTLLNQLDMFLDAHLHILFAKQPAQG